MRRFGGSRTKPEYGFSGRPCRTTTSWAITTRIRAFLTFAWRAARKAAELRGDVVFATSTPLTIALPAVYAARRSKCPMVFEVRDLWPAVPIAIGAIRNPFANCAAPGWSGSPTGTPPVVALAPGMATRSLRPATPRTGHGDPQWLRPRRVRGGEAGTRSRPPLLARRTSAARVYGHVWIRQRHGLSRAVGCAIARIDPEVRIVAVGTGREFEATRALGRGLGVLDRNLFLVGQQPKTKRLRGSGGRHDARSVYRAGSSGATPSKQVLRLFGRGQAGREQFRRLASEIAEQAGAGLIVSQTDADGAAEQVVHALRNREWLQRAGRAARRLATEHFNRDVLAARLASVLDEASASAR